MPGDVDRWQVFDARQEVRVVERRLPHWSQAGTIAFITFRTWDSIPRTVLERFLKDRRRWLRGHGIDSFAEDWRQQAARLDKESVIEFHRAFSDRWNDSLDACHGECLLRREEIANVVSESLLAFDGDRYDLTDFVIMPNHVHLLVAFPDDAEMLRQCSSWKRFTATAINRLLSRRGRFWQQDGFDHLVRSQQQYDYLRRYVAENPQRANLKSTEFIHYGASRRRAK